jgi:serine/threonine protein kinase
MISMDWPTTQDYNDALLNPELSFNDAELKAGQVKLTPEGLPWSKSGDFATVYRMQCGQREWAVRCFRRQLTDQQQRYTAISQYLARFKLPFMVDFEFISQGLLVNEIWYPIVKMEWVNGELLDKFVEKHLHDSATLRLLAKRWVDLIAALEEARIMHGDLQDTNILIVNNDFKLIDYDGIIIPALYDKSCHEIGHPNYQHPNRTGHEFPENIDGFSAWVIYIALLSLSIDPQLWQRVGAGDEFLLLHRRDFINPDASATLKLLIQHSDVRIRSLAIQFKLFCKKEIWQVPSLRESGFR